MNHLKMLGLLVVAAASLMAFASSASATPVLTSQAGVAATTIEMTAESAGSEEESLLMEASVFNSTCTTTTVHADITTNNAEHAKGPITTFSLTGCGTLTVDILALGELTINDAGEVFDIGTKITFQKLGVTCIYGGGLAPGTRLGSLTTGTTASIKIEASMPKQEGSGGLCAARAKWSGKYTVTSPDTLALT